MRMIWVSGRKASVVGLSGPETRNRLPVSAAVHALIRLNLDAEDLAEARRRWSP
jgi:predicted sugar kinase